MGKSMELSHSRQLVSIHDGSIVIPEQVIGRAPGTVVFRASCGLRLVVLKIFRSDQEDLVEIFDREVRLVHSSSGHPHLASFIDTGELPSGPSPNPFQNVSIPETSNRRSVDRKSSLSNGRVDPLSASEPLVVSRYLVTTYEGDRTLCQLLARLQDHDIPWSDKERVMIQILSAFSHLHHLGIAHLNAEPHNIVLDERGSCSIVDLSSGICFHDDSPSVPRQRRVSPPYAAPELLDGDPCLSSDLFALGVIFYRLCMRGQFPFHGKNEIEIIRDMKTGSPSPMGSRVPSSWHTVILSLLSSDPSKRMSADECLKSLESPLLGSRTLDPVPLYSGAACQPSIHPERPQRLETTKQPTLKSSLSEYDTSPLSDTFQEKYPNGKSSWRSISLPESSLLSEQGGHLNRQSESPKGNTSVLKPLQSFGNLGHEDEISPVSHADPRGTSVRENVEMKRLESESNSSPRRKRRELSSHRSPTRSPRMLSRRVVQNSSDKYPSHSVALSNIATFDSEIVNRGDSFVSTDQTSLEEKAPLKNRKVGSKQEKRVEFLRDLMAHTSRRPTLVPTSSTSK